MNTADMFSEFLNNLKLPLDKNKSIAHHYRKITRNLNLYYRGINNGRLNRLKVGSAGRQTAVKNTSDLDMLYILPPATKESYMSGDNPQRRLLQDVKGSLKTSYPKQEIKVDRLVVQIVFEKFHIEVQPVFQQENGSFQYPDTKNGGSWKYTKPKDEIKEMRSFKKNKSKNLHDLCKMLRAWKNRNIVVIGGLLIDTLAWRFLKERNDYDFTSKAYHDEMLRDFFCWMKDEPHQDYYAALGSGQRVKVYKPFQRKAKQAYELCLKAIEAESNGYETTKHNVWRQILGQNFPNKPNIATESAALTINASEIKGNTEQFADDIFSDVRIKYNVEIDCDVKQNGYRETTLRHFLQDSFRRLAHKRELIFKVNEDSLNIPGDYDVYWKVLNCGPEAERRDCIRGHIIKDGGLKIRKETSSFKGDHIVDCYIVQNDIVVAMDRISVPID